MTRIRHLRRLAAALAALAGALLAFAAAAPTALASQLRPDPPWWIGHRALPVHPPLPRGHVTGPVPVYQVPARTAVTGGMPGWQIALIAAAAALLGAALAVLTYRARDAHHKTALSMRQPDERDLISFLSSSFSCCRSAIQQSWYGSDPRMAR